MSRTGTILAPLAALTLAALLTACGGSGAMPTPTPTPVPTYDVTGDGVLRIGTLFPSTGATSFIAKAQVAGVETAVRELNEAGGVNGAPVEVFHRNSGDATSETAEASFAELVAKGVDVVIGPSTSALVERLTAPAVAAGIPLISPAATYPTITDLADSGLISRTIANYGDQGSAIAQELAKSDVAVLYADDVLGNAVLAELEAGVADEGGEVVYSKSFPSTTTDFAAIVAATKKAKPDAVVVATSVGPVQQTQALITALTAAGLGGKKLWLTSENLGDYSQALPAGTMDGVNGTLPGAQPDAAFVARLKQSDPSLSAYAYAAESYDAVIMAALAATVAGDDGGAAIARTLGSISAGGIICTSYGECLDVLTTETDIDYDGISGPVDLTDAGDLVTGSIGIFVYNAANIPISSKVIIAG